MIRTENYAWSTPGPCLSPVARIDTVAFAKCFWEVHAFDGILEKILARSTYDELTPKQKASLHRITDKIVGRAAEWLDLEAGK